MAVSSAGIRLFKFSLFEILKNLTFCQLRNVFPQISEAVHFYKEIHSFTGPPPEYRQGSSGTFSHPDDYDVREGDDPVEVSTDYAPLYPVYENIDRYACAEKEALRDEHKTNPMLEYRNSSS